MKVKELMIGDWVYIFDPDHEEEKEAYKVSEIREKGIRTHMFDDTYEEDWFAPIPLNPSILIQNGFEKTDHNNGFVDYIKTTEIEKEPRPRKQGIRLLGVRKLRVTFYKDTFGVAHSVCRISGRSHRIFEGETCYVHELQHALRLCGLKELADNFKL